MVGPPFLNDLCTILLRFRCHPIAFASDIEKAFLHVVLHEPDRNFMQFLWLLNPEDPDSNCATYCFAAVPFGSASSPFMLNAVLNLHLTKANSTIANNMKSNIYIDNVLSGCDTEDQAVQYYTEAGNIMNRAKFNLRSWASNSHQLQKTAIKDKSVDPNTTVSVLGVRWNTATDTLSFTLKKMQCSGAGTKRKTLKSSSQIYDPFGWATPVTIRAKIFLQELWQRKISWVNHYQKWTGTSG